MKKMVNNVTIEGRVYQHSLEIKKVQNQASANFGKEFIAGNLDVATDEEGLNVVSVHYTYVTATTAKGEANRTYAALKKIIDEGQTWVEHGKDAAMKVKCSTALALNDFYNRENELVSSKTCEGGFVTILKELDDPSERNTFSLDMIITSVTRREANPEQHIDSDYVILRGAAFNFRNAVLPIDLVVRNERGMSFFESIAPDSKNPYCVKVWGKITSTTVKTQITEESQFGEPLVHTTERKIKEWCVTGADTKTLPFGDPEFITTEELTQAMQDREVLLAEIKKRKDEWEASRGSGAVSTTPVASKGEFNF